MPKTQAKQLPPFDLKAEREKRKLSQIALAEKLFQSQGTISRWEISGQAPELAREYWKLICALEDGKLVWADAPKQPEKPPVKSKRGK